jgi:hypothetical protein
LLGVVKCQSILEVFENIFLGFFEGPKQFEGSERQEIFLETNIGCLSNYTTTKKNLKGGGGFRKAFEAFGEKSQIFIIFFSNF